eukprot:5657005-Pyramimonas_sp.AAC.1
MQGDANARPHRTLQTFRGTRAGIAPSSAAALTCGAWKLDERNHCGNAMWIAGFSAHQYLLSTRQRFS